jgi:hypothetical protein
MEIIDTGSTHEGDPTKGHNNPQQNVLWNWFLQLKIKLVTLYE